MKNYLLILLPLCLGFMTCQKKNSEGMHFNKGAWSKVQALAKKEGKLIFIDAHTDWCGPCKLMEQSTFSDPKVADYFNAKFINFKLDAEKGEGPELALKYGIQAVPNLLFVNESGDLVHRAEGFLSADELLNAANTALMQMGEDF
jgi:thiol:disulfide interchange protein